MPKKTDVPARIIRASVALFSRQGYHGTSTRDIARLADISEVTLFRYFERKEDLFWAALAFCFDSLTPRLSALQQGARTAAPEVFVPRILNILIDTATFSPELIRLVAIALIEVQGKAENICREHLAPLFKVIVQNYSYCAASGKVRNLNPAIVALAIAITTLAHPELAKLMEGCELPRLNLRELADTYSEFWVGALVPSSVEGSIPSQTLPQERSELPVSAAFPREPNSATEVIS